MSDDGKEKKPRKRKASAVVVEDDTGIDWKEAFQSGDLSRFKNAELKTKLKSLGESGSGTKSVMVERLMTALEAVYGAEDKDKKNKASEEQDDDDNNDGQDDEDDNEGQDDDEDDGDDE